MTYRTTLSQEKTTFSFCNISILTNLNCWAKRVVFDACHVSRVIVMCIECAMWHIWHCYVHLTRAMGVPCVIRPTCQVLVSTFNNNYFARSPFIEVIMLTTLTRDPYL